ncbi:hypothetical protein LTS08_000653 [Lithohypha guttulata]|nr:hypothetical protein LTS08_000653 [Lithohypha guttulata]
MSTLLDPYQVLGVQYGTPKIQIKKVYRELALKFHPDKAGPASTMRFQQIQDAWERVANGYIPPKPAPPPSWFPQPEATPDPPYPGWESRRTYHEWFTSVEVRTEEYYRQKFREEGRPFNVPQDPPKPPPRPQRPADTQPQWHQRKRNKKKCPFKFEFDESENENESGSDSEGEGDGMPYGNHSWFWSKGRWTKTSRGSGSDAGHVPRYSTCSDSQPEDEKKTWESTGSSEQAGSRSADTWSQNSHGQNVNTKTEEQDLWDVEDL